MIAAEPRRGAPTQIRVTSGSRGEAAGSWLRTAFAVAVGSEAIFTRPFFLYG
jgi:hypothetical protein